MVQAALNDNDVGHAGLLAERALANGETHELLFSLAALRRQHVGDTRGAEELHRNAVQLSPDNPHVLTAAADSLRYSGQFRESIDLFDRALAHDPTLVAAWYGRAMALEAVGALEDARRSFRRVTELAPDTAPGFAGLANTNGQLGNAAEARRCAEVAYRIAPNDHTATLAMVRCDMAEHRYDKAVALLRPLADRVAGSAQDSIAVLTLLGDALDKLGRYDDAFGTYVEANQRFAEIHAGPNAPPVARDRTIALRDAVMAIDPSRWVPGPDDTPGAATRHIFLLGYPRSGTTLVEQALAALPDVATLEEAPTFDDSTANPDTVRHLDSLTDDDIARLRADYWARVHAADIDCAGKTFIDMDLFKAPALPLIARLFPDAKVVIIRRDPRDVVWSCFRRSFIYTPTSYEFTALDRTARHYDATMRLIETATARLPLQVHTIVYEHLVRDFDAATQALCSFVGLDWSPMMREFAETARRNRVKTASAAQVRQPLFDGSGQWRSYADKITPVLPILSPWIVAHDAVIG